MLVAQALAVAILSQKIYRFDLIIMSGNRSNIGFFVVKINLFIQENFVYFEVFKDNA